MRRLSLLVHVLAAVIMISINYAAPPLVPQGKVIWQFFAGRDYRGLVQRGAAEASGETMYLATAANLYMVSDAKAQIISKRPQENAQLVLASGGKVYAWLLPLVNSPGLFTIQIMSISGERLSHLKLKEFPHGFGILYLGFQGKLIVTISPLDDWQGLSGRFLCTFWDRHGKKLNDVVFKEKKDGIISSTGESIVFIGNQEAIAFSADGKDLWRLKGHFRKAAIAGNGNKALLNPASQKNINQVYIYGGTGKPRILNCETPVHHLAISPDGSFAVVAGDNARYFYLEPGTAHMEEGSHLPLEDTSLIADIKIVDENHVAFGLLHRAGKSHPYTWPEGSIIVVDRSGSILFKHVFPIREPLAFIPAIDVDYGAGFFVGRTEDTVIFVNIAAAKEYKK